LPTVYLLSFFTRSYLWIIYFQ